MSLVMKPLCPTTMVKTNIERGLLITLITTHTYINGLGFGYAYMLKLERRSTASHVHKWVMASHRQLWDEIANRCLNAIRTSQCRVYGIKNNSSLGTTKMYASGEY